jgi:hypothetical protein
VAQPLEVVVVWPFDAAVKIKPFEVSNEFVLVAKLSGVCEIARNGLMASGLLPDSYVLLFNASSCGKASTAANTLKSHSGICICRDYLFEYSAAYTALRVV